MAKGTVAPWMRAGMFVGKGLFCWLGLLALLSPGPAHAACLPVAELEPRVIPVAVQPGGPPAEGMVRLTFLGHASFLIESPSGVSAVTDYNGRLTPPALPDIVTMNNAEANHYTDAVEGIEHVLRGWDPAGGVATHDVMVRDMRVWNVPTDERDAGGGKLANSNSIFVFEVAGLCIAHLGIPRQALSDAERKELGMIDVLLVPIGGYAVGLDAVLDLIDQLRPAVVVPMHYYGAAMLDRFVDRIRERYEVKVSEGPSVTLSRASLPYRQVLVLPGS